MLVPDVNLLVYAYTAQARQHAAARSWLVNVLRKGEPIGFPIFSVVAFVRILTNPQINKQGFLTPEASVAIVDRWLQAPGATLLLPGRRYWALLSALISRHGVSGPLVADAQIAVLAIEHNGVVCTTDRDFAIFTDVPWTNPIA